MSKDLWHPAYRLQSDHAIISFKNNFVNNENVYVQYKLYIIQYLYM